MSVNKILPSLFFSSFITGCTPAVDTWENPTCPNKDIKILGENEGFVLDTAPIIKEDLDLFTELHGPWLCGLDRIYIIDDVDEKEALGLYQSAYGYNHDRITMYIKPEAYEYLLSDNRNSIGYLIERYNVRFILFHEIGHYISNKKTKPDSLDEYAAHSFTPISDCNGRNQNDELADCWELRDNWEPEDFVGESFTDTTIGASGANEDWSQTFAVSALSLLDQDPTVTSNDTIFISENYYSEIGWEKVDWMTDFIESNRD